MLMIMTFILMGQPAAEAPNVKVEKKVIYQSETTIDLEGSKVTGENQLPPAFFVMNMKSPNGESLLRERLKFGLRDYNELGF